MRPLRASRRRPASPGPGTVQSSRGALARPRLIAAALLAGFALGAAGCGGSEKLVVRKVLVDVVPGAEGPGGVFEREKLRQIVERHLADDRRVQRVEAGDEAAVLRVRLESTSVTPGEGAERGRSVSMVVEVSGGPVGGRRYHYQAHAVASATGDVLFPDLAVRALADCVGQVAAGKAAQHEGSETLLAWLADEHASEGRKRQAVRLLGARKERQGVPVLAKLLAGDDQGLAQAALGALTLIGDAAAVPAVIAYAEGKPNLVRKQAIEAVRVMGSRLGMAWLFTLSTGHRDPDVQMAAALALSHLERQALADPADPTRVADSAEERGRLGADPLQRLQEPSNRR